MARKKKPTPTVKRGASGKIESLRTPIAPLSDQVVTPKKDVRFAVPEKEPKKRTRTRTGKKLDKVTGKVLTPTVQRGEDGKIVGIPKEKRANITVLPEVGPKPEKKSDALISMGASPIKKGFAVSYPLVESATKAALHHLSGMHTSEPNSPEFHEHHEAFNLIHANILKMSPELHTSLGQAKHEITHPNDKTAGNLALIHTAITSRLAIGRAVHTDNLKRATEGNPT